jgi:hypothetical protein
VAGRLAASCLAEDACFRAPLRSLIGAATCLRSGETYDVALVRDREHPESRFSLILGQDRSKDARRARVLAEVVGGDLMIRGAEVALDQRGKGLSSLALACFMALSLKSHGQPPTTVTINKPLLALSLAGLGFVPINPKWPVLIARPNDLDDAGRTLLCRECSDDRRLYFSNAVVAAQRLTVVDSLGDLGRVVGARRAHVRTGFVHGAAGGDAETLRCVVDARVDVQFHAARLVAFAATLEAWAPLVFKASTAAAAAASCAPPSAGRPQREHPSQVKLLPPPHSKEPNQPQARESNNTELYKASLGCSSSF